MISPRTLLTFLTLTVVFILQAQRKSLLLFSWNVSLLILVSQRADIVVLQEETLTVTLLFSVEETCHVSGHKGKKTFFVSPT